MKPKLPQPAFPMNPRGWVELPPVRVGDSLMVLTNPWSVFEAGPEPGTLVTVYKASPISKDGYQAAVGIRWKGAKAGKHKGSSRAGKLGWWPLRQPSDPTILTVSPLKKVDKTISDLRAFFL